MRNPGRIRWAILLVPVLVGIGCRSGPSEGWSGRARTMLLTSGPAEIGMSSSRVQGYWARQAGGEEAFFLCTRDRSFGKGDRVMVEGPFGPASPAVFREETGEYWKWYPRPVLVLVVWKIGRMDDAKRP